MTLSCPSRKPIAVDYLDRSGEQLARRVSMSERQARDHLRTLEACGAIERVSGGRGDGGGQTTRCRLNLPAFRSGMTDPKAIQFVADALRVAPPQTNKCSDAEQLLDLGISRKTSELAQRIAAMSLEKVDAIAKRETSVTDME